MTGVYMKSKTPFSAFQPSPHISTSFRKCLLIALSILQRKRWNKHSVIPEQKKCMTKKNFLHSRSLHAFHCPIHPSMKTSFLISVLWWNKRNQHAEQLFQQTDYRSDRQKETGRSLRHERPVQTCILSCHKQRHTDRRVRRGISGVSWERYFGVEICSYDGRRRPEGSAARQEGLDASVLWLEYAG